MKYKNAGIDSFITAEKRLREGELFYSGNSIIYYDFNYVKGGQSPYRIRPYGDPLSASCPIVGSWEGVSMWKIKLTWQENLPEHPRLCWVNSEQATYRFVVLVIGYNPAIPHMYSTYDVDYRYAVPLTKAEIRIYLENADD